MKSFARAKTRLGNLSPAERVELAESFFDHVVSLLGQSRELGGILVATNGDDVAALASHRNCSVLRDTVGRPEPGLSGVVDAALTHLATAGAGAAVVLMADLPTLAGDDIDRLITAMRQYDVVLAPDRHERGTNALGLDLPSRMPTCFGREDSFSCHLGRSWQHQLRVWVERSPGLAFDVDVPADYRELFPRHKSSS
ncbi:MAG: 2-phospho-L-lactate guanylyltransferase [Proteobacteria bacterium]|nr:2-phospho-L-lactate guanylyltransferase [Pseudomonadota bacterium]